MIRIYYCRKCGNYSYFRFKAEYEYNANLRGLVYSDIMPVKLEVNKVICKVCQSDDVGYVDFERAEDIPDLVSIAMLKGDDRIKAFENMRKEFGGGLMKEQNEKGDEE